MKKKLLLTKEKRESLEKELKNLEEKKRPEISSILEHARQNDLSEDTDDLSVMLEEKETIEDRILEIRDLIANSQIIRKLTCNQNVIGIGSEITVEHNNKTQVMKLVSSIEADPLKGYLSEKSPLGKALMKAQTGKTVTIKVNGKTFEYKVLKIC